MHAPRPTALLILTLLLAGTSAPGAAQQRSIGDVMYDLLEQGNIETTINRFHELQAAAPDSITFGESELNALGYRLVNEERPSEAIAVFELNRDLYPGSVNVYDSLAEAYAAAGRRQDAAVQYRRVLEMLPEAGLPNNQTNLYRTNAETFLFVAGHFDPRSPDALHYVGLSGGVPAVRWDMETLARFRERHSDTPISYRASNLYRSPVPTTADVMFDTDSPADVSSSFLGGVYWTRVEDGSIADISDLWEENNWEEVFPEPFRRMARTNGRYYFVPLAFQWNPVWYRKDIFDELGLSPPETWEELLALCDTLNEAGYTPFSVSVSGWTPPAVRWFSILNLRLNGSEFHERLLRGHVPFTDDRIREVFRYWTQLFEHGAFAEKSAANNYAKGIQDLVEGRAVMYNLGEWIYESLPDGYDKLDYFMVPQIDPDVPHAEIVDVFGAFMLEGSEHPRTARKLLSYLGGAESQTTNVRTLGRIASNNRVDPALYTDVQRRAYTALKDVEAFVPLLEFAMPPELAQAMLDGVVRFWSDPRDVNAVLEDLEATRQEVMDQP